MYDAIDGLFDTKNGVYHYTENFPNVTKNNSIFPLKCVSGTTLTNHDRFILIQEQHTSPH